MKDYNIDSKVKFIITIFLFNSSEQKNNNKVYVHTNNNLTNPKTIVVKNILHIIILCISIIVVYIPKKLSLAVNLSLSFSIKNK